MKAFLIAASLGLAAFAATAPASAQVNQRQWNQQHRIQQGVRSGEITRREAYRLQRQQNRIARYEQRSRWDGRGLSYREHQRIAQMQNRAGRNIYSQKHDRQDRDRYGYGRRYR